MPDSANPADVAIVVSGLATIDVLTYPAPLTEPIGRGILRSVERIDVATGGCVSNVALALARLGIPVAALTTVGADSWGQLLRERLQAGGVECSGVLERTSGTTSVSNVLVDRDSARSFLFAPGVSADLDIPGLAAAIERFPQAQWLLFGYYSLFPACDRKLPELFAAARQVGLRTALDAAGSGGGLHPLRAVLPLLDLYLPSYDEAAHQTGLDDPRRMIECFRTHGSAGIVGIKLGDQGALLSESPGDFMHVPAIRPPAPLIDTTGAGDAFFAGLLAGLTRKLNLADAARFAAATAAWSITALGASAGVQSWDQTWALAFPSARDTYRKTV